MLFIPSHTRVAGFYDTKLVIRLSVCLSVCRTSILLFQDDNLDTFPWVFTKLGMCIDIVDFWFRVAIGQIS